MPRRRLPVLLLAVLLSFSPLYAKENFQAPGPVLLRRDGQKWADKTLQHLTLEQKIGQMFMLRAPYEFLNLYSPEYILLRDTVQRYHIGGLLLTVRVEGPFLYRNQPYEAAFFTNQFQRDSELPLIFAADFERGLAMRLNGVTAFPHAMAFGAAGNPAFASAFGRISAQEARAIGVEWNFFPVADVNSNPANPIINTRSFGEDPRQVGELATAFIRASREYGVLTTAKHFPGHGDTDTDSHLSLARVGGDPERLSAVELQPFQMAIAAGVDAVMVAHVTVPALEPDPNRVASTSPSVIQEVLKHKLAFSGLVVTDAMDMNALTRLYNGSGRAAVEAVKSGNDMVLIPENVDAAYNAVLNAVRSGEIPQAQIDASVRKILEAKASVGLHKARLVDVNALSTLIARPENVALGQQVADAAMTLLRENGKVLPLRPAEVPGTNGNHSPYHPAERSKGVVAVVFTDDVRTEGGRVFERELRARISDTGVFFVDPRIADGSTETVLEAVAHAESVVVAVYSAPSAGKVVRVQGKLQASLAVDDASARLLRAILARTPERTVVVALGSPYIGSAFPEIENYLCTFSTSTVSELSAVRALTGEIAIHGRSPVTIPNLAERGAGLDRPSRVSRNYKRGSHAHSN